MYKLQENRNCDNRNKLFIRSFHIHITFFDPHNNLVRLRDTELLLHKWETEAQVA